MINIYLLFYKIRKVKGIFSYLKNIVRYRKELSLCYHDYAPEAALKTFQRSLIILKKYIEKKGHEVDETRIPKINDMQRVIVLLDRQVKCNFIPDAEKRLNIKNNLDKIPLEYLLMSDNERKKNLSNKQISEIQKYQDNYKKLSVEAEKIANEE